MEEKDIYQELNSIRSLMERSTKFISLSGLSGVMAGIYALAGAVIAFRITDSLGIFKNDDYSLPDGAGIIFPLFVIALVVLILSITTCIWLSTKNARKKGQHVWNPASKSLLSGMAVPLVAGGLFILILLQRGDYGIIASACLVFYGLALVAGSPFTFSDVKWLGFLEITLGLLAALMPGYGLILWAIGFGFLHIIYGSVMHYKYQR